MISKSWTVLQFTVLISVFLYIISIWIPFNIAGAKSVCKEYQCLESLSISQSKLSTSPSLTVVTGVSDNHFCALESFLYSIHELRDILQPWEQPRVVVYDLGLKEKHLKIVDHLVKNGLIDEFVVFDYSKYPAFWNIRRRRGEYAWKSGIVNEVRLKYGGYIVWMDSGDIPGPEFFRRMPVYLEKHGFWSPRSMGIMDSFTHEGMFKYFGQKKDDYANNINCNGAALGFNAENPYIVENLMIPWYNCALVHHCIAPPGSSRINHRQDQAVITYLAYKSGFACVEQPEFYGITVHQDGECAARLILLEKLGVLFHPSSQDPGDNHQGEKSETEVAG